ncbi:hypothetical protein HYX08_06205 [Candidatus Woesearchaeota archaeon]|nr:hypothetical protein [Candidatus Woesearchaeota archaeon]
MSKFYSNLLFSIAVTAVMNALDMMYHLSTGWAVHLNYVAIKLTVIFLSTWMITQFIGIGKEEGIVASIFGPFIFYIYYVFAGATLNRDVFKIDEQFWFFFLHFALMLIAYFAALSFLKSEKKWLATPGFVVTVSFISIALHALLVMVRMRLQGIEEEEATTLMTLGIMIFPAISYAAGAVIGIVAERLSGKRLADVSSACLAAAAAVWYFTGEISTGIFALAFVLAAYYMAHTFKKGLGSGA